MFETNNPKDFCVGDVVKVFPHRSATWRVTKIGRKYVHVDRIGSEIESGVEDKNLKADPYYLTVVKMASAKDLSLTAR